MVRRLALGATPGMPLHASCAALRGDGVLILGPPGAGKSELVLRLLGRGWDLVADDQVEHVVLLEDGAVGDEEDRLPSYKAEVRNGRVWAKLF